MTIANSPLSGIHSAASRGDLAMIKNLVSRQKSQNIATSNEEETSQNYLRLINGPNRFGWSPLHAACFHERLQIVEYLIMMGVDVRQEARRNPWTTALHLAALKGNVAIITCLLEAGADPTRTDSCGMSAEQIAAQCGHRQAAVILKDSSKKCTSTLNYIKPITTKTPDYASKFETCSCSEIDHIVPSSSK